MAPADWKFHGEKLENSENHKQRAPMAELLPPFSQLGQHEKHPWKPLPWPGISNKVLYFDRISGATIELAKIEKDAEFPEHYHSSVQTLFLISGRLRSGSTITLPGTFNVIPAGELHGPFFGEEESITLKFFSAVPVYFLKDGSSYIYKEDGRVVAIHDGSMKEFLGVQNILR
jgi:quercetin dioxygenase-like cupin family protein